jgi:hypothetical protein
VRPKHFDTSRTKNTISRSALLVGCSIPSPAAFLMEETPTSLYPSHIQHIQNNSTNQQKDITSRFTCNYSVNMKQSHMISAILCLFATAPVFGWIEATSKPTYLLGRSTQQLQRQYAGTILKSDNAADPNPCWQDMYDEDCAMETIFQAQYVASDWIKNLPCAKGLEVSRMSRLGRVIGDGILL